MTIQTFLPVVEFSAKVGVQRRSSYLRDPMTSMEIDVRPDRPLK